MRAPDHPTGDGAGGDGAAAGNDGANGGDAADTGTGNAGDAQTGGEQGTAAGDQAGQSGDGADTASGSLVKQAAAKSSAGKDQEGSEGGDGAAAGDKPVDDDDKDDAVPEAYDLSGLKISIKDAEGNDTEADLAIDAALLEKATPLLKEAGLTNDQAKKLAPAVLDIKARALEEQQSEFATIAANWAKEAKADPEIGGKNWAATEHAMGRAFDRFGTPELDQVLEDSSLGNHPAVVKFFASVGKAMGEDEAANRAAAAAVAPKAREEVLYPNDQPPKT